MENIVRRHRLGAVVLSKNAPIALYSMGSNADNRIECIRIASCPFVPHKYLSFSLGKHNCVFSIIYLFNVYANVFRKFEYMLH